MQFCFPFLSFLEPRAWLSIKRGILSLSFLFLGGVGVMSDEDEEMREREMLLAAGEKMEKSGHFPSSHLASVHQYELILQFFFSVGEMCGIRWDLER